MRLTPDFDFEKLAQVTPGYVGADLKALVSKAANEAVHRMFQRPSPKGEIAPAPGVDQNDLKNSKNKNVNPEHQDGSKEIYEINQEKIKSNESAKPVENKTNVYPSREEEGLNKPIENVPEKIADTGVAQGVVNALVNKIVETQDIQILNISENKNPTVDSTVSSSTTLDAEKIFSSDVASASNNQEDMNTSSEKADSEGENELTIVEDEEEKNEMEKNLEDSVDESKEESMEIDIQIQTENATENTSNVTVDNPMTQEEVANEPIVIQVEDDDEEDSAKADLEENKNESEEVSIVGQVNHMTDEIRSKCSEPVIERSALKLIKEDCPLSNFELNDLFIMMSDFESALKQVQPSSKREGFATVPDITWDDIGALQDIREELQVSILVSHIA